MTEMKNGGGHRLNLYADLYGSMLLIAIDQFIGNGQGIVEYFIGFRRKRMLEDSNSARKF